MKKKVISAVLTALLLFTGCSSTANTGSVNAGKEGGTIRIGTMTDSELLYVVAVGKEKGIFDKYNITIEDTEFASGIESVDAIAQGQLDIGYVADFAGVNRIGNTIDSTDLNFFTVNNYSGDSYVLYYNPETVSDVRDIKGKTIKSKAGTVNEYWVYKYITQLGLTEDDVNIINIDDASTTIALASTGDVDLVFANAPVQIKLKELGWEASDVTAKTVGSVVYSLLIANKSYLEENKELVARFLDAYTEAQDFILENPEEAADIVYKRIGLDQEIFLAYIEAANLGLGLPQEAIDDLQEINVWAREYGLYDAEYDVNDYIYKDVLELVKK